jgi:hypothetical protein
VTTGSVGTPFEPHREEVFAVNAQPVVSALARRARRVAAIVLASVVSAALPATASATSPSCAGRAHGSISIVGRFARPVKAQFVERGGHLVAPLNLLLKSDRKASGCLAITFFSSSSGRYLNLRRGVGQPTRYEPVLFIVGGLPSPVAPDQLRPLRLRLALAKGAVGAAANGFLVLRLGRHPPVSREIVPVVGALPAMNAPPKRKPEPDSVTLVVTSWLPFWHGYLHREHTHVLIPASTLAAGKSVRTFLDSESGGVMRATLEASDQLEQKMRRAQVRTSNIGTTGKYQGKFTFGPDQDPELPVVVHLRDALIWPILVVALGAFLGGFLIQRWERKRRKDLLRVALERAVRQYRGAPDLDLPPDENWPYSLESDGDESLGEDNLADLRKKIDEANGDDEYQAARDRVLAILDDVRRWLLVHHAIGRLLDQARHLPEPVRTDTETLLAEETWQKPKDEQAAQTMLATLGRQQELLEAFASAWHYFLRMGDRLLPLKLDPRNVYEDLGGAVARDPAKGEDAIRRFQGLVVALQKKFEEPPSVEEEKVETLAYTKQELDAAVRGARRFLEVSARPRRVPSLPTPEQILQHIRLWDLVSAIAVGVGTVVVYVLTTYGDKDFGTLRDYITAFGVGFAGQALTVVWSNFPAFRSYAVVPPKPASK